MWEDMWVEKEILWSIKNFLVKISKIINIWKLRTQQDH